MSQPQGPRLGEPRGAQAVVVDRDGTRARGSSARQGLVGARCRYRRGESGARPPALDIEQVKAQGRAVIHGWSQGLERERAMERERHRELDRQRSLERGHCRGRGQVRSFGAMGPTMI